MELFDGSKYEVYLEPTEFTCISCAEVITDENHYFDDRRYIQSDKAEGDICWPCYEWSLEGASTAHVVRDGEVTTYKVTDYFAMDQWGEEPWATDDVFFSRGWVSTDGWRGYGYTKVEDWEEVPGLSGWTTGGWGDATSNRKQTFNEWASGVVSGEIEVPVPVTIVADTTSNVFSTAITVWVPDGKSDEFLAWLGDKSDALSGALG